MWLSTMAFLGLLQVCTGLVQVPRPPRRSLSITRATISLKDGVHTRSWGGIAAGSPSSRKRLRRGVVRRSADNGGGGGGGGGPRLQGPGGSEASAEKADALVLSLSALLTFILVVNRLLVDNGRLYDPGRSQTDLIAVAAIAGLAVNSVSSLDVTSREAERVELKGVRGRGLSKLVMEGGSVRQAGQPASSLELFRAFPPSLAIDFTPSLPCGACNVAMCAGGGVW